MLERQSAGVYVSGPVAIFDCGHDPDLVVSYLNIRGARLTGLITDWLGVIMMVPLILMSVVGIAAWIKSGTTIHLPFLVEWRGGYL